MVSKGRPNVKMLEIRRLAFALLLLTAGINDTWVYNGMWWTQVNTSGPPARIQFVMAYDSKRDRIVAFGGMSAQNQYLGDVWEFDGKAWETRSP
jgi:hypothetical protein